MTPAHATTRGRGQIDRMIAAIAKGLEAVDLRLAGTARTKIAQVTNHHCDMDLRLLPAGPVLRLNEDHSPQTRGCHLDTGALEQISAPLLAHLDGADRLVINKFGRRWRP